MDTVVLDIQQIRQILNICENLNIAPDTNIKINQTHNGIGCVTDIQVKHIVDTLPDVDAKLTIYITDVSKW